MKTAQVLRRIGFDEWGGTETVVWNTSRILEADGFNPDILATRVLGTLPFEKKDNLSIRRFPCFYPYFPLSREKKRILDKKGGNPFCPALERHLSSAKYDLIHCHASGRIAELCARVAERRHLPLVLSFHGGFFDVPEAEKQELVKPLRNTIPYGGVLERIFRWKIDSLKRADGLICVGENEKSEFEKHCPGKRILYLPNGVDTEKYSAPGPCDWRGRLGLDPSTELLLCVSRIDYQKNQKILVEFLARLKGLGRNVHLLLIGPLTSEWYASELRKLAVSLGVEKYLTLVPGLPPGDPEIVSAYHAADVFLLPSLHEPFGIVVLEAWSAGVPVIAARVGGLGRLVGDGKTGLLFDPSSQDSLMEAYTRLPGLRESMVAAASAEVRTKYTWRAVTSRLESFYQELVDAYSLRG